MCWEGIYNNIDEINNDIGTLDNDLWVNKQIEKSLKFNNQLAIFKKENKELIDLCKNYKEKIKILDFGGSLGFSYLTLIGEVNKENIEYYIVENNKIANIGKKILTDVIFLDEIPKKLDIDILYIRTSLQYVNNWEETLNSLSELKPKNIILSHLSAGKISTYLTTQIWNEMKIPYWFINIKEIEQLLNNKGYKLKSKTDCEILSDCWDKCRDKFPKEYILNKTCNLILE